MKANMLWLRPHKYKLPCKNKLPHNTAVIKAIKR